MIHIQQIWQYACSPSCPVYYPLQFGITAGFFYYLSSRSFSVVSPKQGITFLTIVIVVDRLVCPIFTGLLENYGRLTLIPFLGTLAHLSFSIIVTKGCCSLLGYSLNLKQIYMIGVFYLVSLCVVKRLYESSRPTDFNRL